MAAVAAILDFQMALKMGKSILIIYFCMNKY